MSYPVDSRTHSCCKGIGRHTRSCSHDALDDCAEALLEAKRLARAATAGLDGATELELLIEQALRHTARLRRRRD